MRWYCWSARGGEASLAAGSLVKNRLTAVDPLSVVSMFSDKRQFLPNAAVRKCEFSGSAKL